MLSFFIALWPKRLETVTHYIFIRSQIKVVINKPSGMSSNWHVILFGILPSDVIPLLSPNFSDVKAGGGGSKKTIKKSLSFSYTNTHFLFSETAKNDQIYCLRIWACYRLHLLCHFMRSRHHRRNLLLDRGQEARQRVPAAGPREAAQGSQG